LAKNVTINGTTYNLPQQGDSPPWGESLSDLIEALVSVANNTISTGDILTTSFAVANNITSQTNVTGLLFDPAAVRSAVIEYSIYRATSDTELSEGGVMLVTYKSGAGTWEVAQYSVGDAGITFTCSNSGQFKYTSTNLSGTSYTGLLKFKARAMTQG
jgi:hypothetical protein